MNTKNENTANELFQTPTARILDDVSLICTVFNEEESISRFLNSILMLSVFPTEFIIVDGGSSDRTAAIIQEFINRYHPLLNVRLIQDATCNLKYSSGPIAKGRNVAIHHSTQSIIVCTDAGCTLDINWLKNIVTPFYKDNTVDVVGGGYLAETETWFEKCVEQVTIMPLESIEPTRFTPSARSLAFTKKAWLKVGGFPESSYTGEDTMFFVNLKKVNCKYVFMKEAIVFWRMRATLNVMIRQLYRYGIGDGVNAIMVSNVVKNVIKLSVPILLFLLAIIYHPSFLFLLLLYWLLLPFIRKMRELFVAANLTTLPVVAFLKIIADVSYVLGYVVGTFKRIRNKNNA
ncbi:MAG: glycosyltransferase [Ignavibacteriae bacterium]|nr:glycosyltransferase [Ignavibacteriota bacterium]